MNLQREALWHDEWWHTAAPATHTAWRGVEAQHIVATLKLVDSLEEQDLLEQLLEASKPPLPQNTGAEQHYLLTTPFRYRSPHASRFRRPHEPGLWYGAIELPTAYTEVAYWRWRFLMDSEGLRDHELVTEHTFFQARVAATKLIDLTSTPWDLRQAQWTLSRDYGPCHQLATAARTHGIEALMYASARVAQPACGHCLAIFTPTVLSLPSPVPQQHWVCKVTRDQALLVHQRQRATVRFDRVGDLSD